MSQQKNTHLKNNVKIGWKMTELFQFNVQAAKWHLAYFVPIDGQIFWDMDFKFVLPLIYINFDIKTNFELNWTQIDHFIHTNLQNITKMAISQNPILRKCHSPKSLLLLHFAMNLSETFRIDERMNFANTNWANFWFRPPKKIWVQNPKNGYNPASGGHNKVIIFNVRVQKKMTSLAYF